MITAKELAEERARNKRAKIDYCLLKIQEALLESKTNTCVVKFNTITTGPFVYDIANVMLSKDFKCGVRELPNEDSVIYTISWEEEE
jgi:hypothetical protein